MCKSILYNESYMAHGHAHKDQFTPSPTLSSKVAKKNSIIFCNGKILKFECLSTHTRKGFYTDQRFKQQERYVEGKIVPEKH